MNSELATGMLITIGRVVKPWGVRGDVKIEPMTDFPERFRGLKRVFLVSPAGKEVEASVASVRSSGGSLTLRFDTISTPEQARTLNGWYVKLPEQEAVPLPEGMYYWFELIGMEVMSEAGEQIGTLTDIFETGSNDVYVVKRGRREIYLPATKDVVRQVDRSAKRMIIRLVDGLMD